MITVGTTPLHLAAENGHLVVCRLIITIAEEKNPKDIFQNTPLHYAAKSGHLEVSKIIYSKSIISGLSWFLQYSKLSI